MTGMERAETLGFSSVPLNFGLSFSMMLCLRLAWADGGLKPLLDGGRTMLGGL